MLEEPFSGSRWLLCSLLRSGCDWAEGRGFHPCCLSCPGAAPRARLDEVVPHCGKEEVAMRSDPFGFGPIQAHQLCSENGKTSLLPFPITAPVQPAASSFSGNI